MTSHEPIRLVLEVFDDFYPSDDEWAQRCRQLMVKAMNAPESKPPIKPSVDFLMDETFSAPPSYHSEAEWRALTEFYEYVNTIAHVLDEDTEFMSLRKAVEAVRR